MGSASGPRSGMCPVSLGEEQGMGGEDAGEREGAGDGKGGCR